MDASKFIWFVVFVVGLVIGHNATDINITISGAIFGGMVIFLYWVDYHNEYIASS